MKVYSAICVILFLSSQFVTVDSLKNWLDVNSELDLCIDKKGASDLRFCLNSSTDSYGGDFRKFDIISPLEIIKVDVFTFLDRSCFCDSECRKYGDCCPDVPVTNPEDEKFANRMKCVHLPGASSLNSESIYAVSKCDPSWDHSNFVRDKCEFEQESSFDYLQYIPVQSKTTNITYRNFHCAICNFDDSLRLWNVSIKCNHNVEEIDSKFFSPANFLPSRLLWKNSVPNNYTICRIFVEEFKDGLSYAIGSNSRSCEPVVDFCTNGNKEDELKCKSYSSHVFHTDELGDVTRYNNYHCAKCNNLLPDNITCGHIPNPGSTLGRVHKKGALTILFDVNQGENIYCNKGQLFDPIKRTCVDIYCGKLFKFVDGNCVRDSTIPWTNDSLSSDCPKVSLSPSDYQVYENSSIKVNKNQKLFFPGEYELISESNDKVNSVLICADESYVVQVFEYNYSQQVASNICVAISIICLVLHIFCYSVVPKFRNLPGKNLLCLSSCLLAGQLLFISFINFEKSEIMCSVFAAFIHFFFLAYFLWMNVMSFDICRTFSSDVYRKNSDSKTFFKYSVFVWTLSSVIIMVAILLDVIDGVPVSMQPQYGLKQCWINGFSAMIVFFIAPIFILLFCNVLMFFMTAINIMKTQNVSKMAIRRKNSTKFLLYLKLALIMGLTWTFVFIQVFYESVVLQYLFIFFNGLQGAFIFLAFSCKKKVFNHISENIIRKRDSYSVTTASYKTSSSPLTISSNGKRNNLSSQESPCSSSGSNNRMPADCNL